jgi:hypothetical protein
MVLHHRRRRLDPCRSCRVLPPSGLPREHQVRIKPTTLVSRSRTRILTVLQVALRGRKRNGTVPRYPVERRQARGSRRYLGWPQSRRQRPLHLDVLRHALLSHQRPVVQGLLPFGKLAKIVAQLWQHELTMAQIIKTFGFSELNTYLIQAPPYAIAYACACALAWSSGKFRESCYHIIVPVVASAVGISIMISTPNIAARYFGACLLVSGTYNGLNLQLSWETTLVPAPRSKKAALIAIANCVSQCSHWFSPYFFPTKHEPYYRLGGGLILFGCLCTVLLCWLVKWWAKRLNKALDEAEGYSEQGGVERGWRYVY